MKKLKLIGFLIIVASSLMFIQCTTDSIAGPPGIAGVDGVDGVNGGDGINGEDGTATCVACHSDSHRDPINDSYALSSHKNQTVMYDGSLLTDYTNQSYFGGSCARCHSNEGFIDYASGNPAATIDSPTVISCTTCHDQHSTFDFENDGYDFALRTFDPVTLIVDADYTVDFGDTSNSCANCHQPRTGTPIDDGNGSFTVTSTHWGPHHGPQTTLLEGIQGAHLVGSTPYPTPQSAAHRTGSSCVSCHMGETTDGNDGAHSWVPTTTACTNCHGDTPPSEVGGMTADMATLAALLEAVEGVDADGNPVIGIVHEGHPQKGTFSIKETHAAWNYLFIVEDKSNGLHNPGYSKALIKNSIEALQ